MQRKYVTTASHMYYVDVNRLRTLWNSCGLVSVRELVVPLLYSHRYSINWVMGLTESIHLFSNKFV